jgi:uncharacterized short protein YbdD (DUF466 family)
MTLRDMARGVHWYLREVTGETAYERYVAHMRAEHTDQPVMSRRDFERHRQQQREGRQSARCC